MTIEPITIKYKMKIKFETYNSSRRLAPFNHKELTGELTSKYYSHQSS
jgi:hypothetical protein